METRRWGDSFFKAPPDTGDENLRGRGRGISRLENFVQVPVIDRFDDIFPDDRVKVFEGDYPAGERIRLAPDDDLEIVIVPVPPLVAAFAEHLKVPLRRLVRPEKPVPGIEAVKTAEIDGTHVSSP